MKSSIIKAIGGVSLGAAILGIAMSVSAQTGTYSCPLGLSFMKLDAANKVSDVAKLQAFLKVSQSADVDVTGIFDQKTEDAVSAFQRAHMSEVMAPWDATRPTGVVYLTTAKMIDKIACGVPLALNNQELATIDSYKSAAAAATASSDGSPAAVSVSDDLSAVASPTVDLVPDGVNPGASLISRFWYFLFGR